MATNTSTSFVNIDEMPPMFGRYKCSQCQESLNLEINSSHQADALADVRCDWCGQQIRSIPFNKKERYKFDEMIDATLLRVYDITNDKLIYDIEKDEL